MENATFTKLLNALEKAYHNTDDSVIHYEISTAIMEAKNVLLECISKFGDLTSEEVEEVKDAIERNEFEIMCSKESIHEMEHYRMLTDEGIEW